MRWSRGESRTFSANRGPSQPARLSELVSPRQTINTVYGGGEGRPYIVCFQTRRRWKESPILIHFVIAECCVPIYGIFPSLSLASDYGGPFSRRWEASSNATLTLVLLSSNSTLPLASGLERVHRLLYKDKLMVLRFSHLPRSLPLPVAHCH